MQKVHTFSNGTTIIQDDDGSLSTLVAEKKETEGNEGGEGKKPNAGNSIKPNKPDGKKNKAVMPVNKGVATAGKGPYCKACDCKCNEDGVCPECGKKVEASNTKTQVVAQSNATPKDNTMPKDIEDDVDAGVPRDKSVGLDQTAPTQVPVYTHEYQRGDKGSDTSIVPRSGAGGDGVSDHETTFEPELANDQTSGNPDDYIQSVQPRQKPTPGGDSENRAVVAKDDKQTKIAELETELRKAKRREQQLKIESERQRLAFRVVKAELERGLIEDDENTIEERIASLSKESVESLARELERVKKYASITQTASRIETASVGRTTAGFEGLGGYALQDVITGTPGSNGDLPTISGTPAYPTNTTQDRLAHLIAQNTRLGRMYENYTGPQE